MKDGNEWVILITSGNTVRDKGRRAGRRNAGCGTPGFDRFRMFWESVMSEYDQQREKTGEICSGLFYRKRRVDLQASVYIF